MFRCDDQAIEAAQVFKPRYRPCQVGVRIDFSQWAKGEIGLLPSQIVELAPRGFGQDI